MNDDVKIDLQSFIEREGNWQYFSVDELNLVKRNDHYVAILGYASKKGTTAKVELALTPNNKKLFSVRYRKKSIKGLNVISKTKLKNLESDLKTILENKESCLNLINCLTSTETISRFNL